MYNLSQILSDVNEYCRRFKEISHLLKPSCKDENCILIGWGTYFRKGTKFSMGETFDIPIKRSYCKTCAKTLSFLPPFLLPRKRYTAETIDGSFKEWCFGKKLSQLCQNFHICEESTLKRWFYPIKKKVKQIKEKAYKFLSRKVYHLREKEMLLTKEEFKKGKELSNLYIFLDNISSTLQGLGHIKRPPYHYALVLLH